MIYEEQYRKLLIDIIKNGDLRKDRTGVGTKALFHKQLSIQLLTESKLGLSKITGENFPILKGKHMSQKIFDTEFEWFMQGETNIQRFKDNDVHIWDNWATPEGELGPVYGYQLRNFNGQDIDQLKNLIDNMNNDRHSRRHVISLWNPAMTEQMALPPCYLYFAAQTNTLPNKLDVSIIDAHIYTNHFDAVGKYIEQTNYKDDCSFTYESGNLVLHNYEPGPIIKAEVAV